MKDRDPAFKGLDAPSEVILVDPITRPIARGLARLKVHPLTLTFLAFLCRITAGILFILGSLQWGAICSIAGFYLDGCDGKVARIRQIDEELHGTTDFMLDHVAFAFMEIGAVIWAINNGHNLTVVLLVGWLALYMVFMSFTSTMFRILSQRGIKYQEITYIGKEFVETSENTNRKNPLVTFIRKPASIYFWAKEKSARFRMSPYLGAIESEISIFMLAPMFNFNNVLVALSIVFLLPDTLFTTLLNMIKVLDARKKA